MTFFNRMTPLKLNLETEQKKEQAEILQVALDLHGKDSDAAYSSLIQTILSVLEFHQISHRFDRSRTVTAGGELHPAPKKFLCAFRINYSADQKDSQGRLLCVSWGTGREEAVMAASLAATSRSKAAPHAILRDA
jgi:hypothetical protein